MSGIQWKITTYADKQENMRHNEEKNQPIKNDPELN